MISNVTPKLVKIGVTDLTIDLFESQYLVPDGITYNSFLIESDTPAIMDSVDASFTDEWLANVAEALHGRLPGYLIVHHLEPDHSGSIAAAMEAYPAMKLVVSTKAAAMLPNFFPESASWADRIVSVSEGATLEIAPGHELKFFMAPMIHWPEVMATYDAESKTLFTADAFGTFGTDAGHREWAPEAARYYFNICGKYGAQVQALLRKAAALDIERICPLHGPVLDGDLSYFIGLYNGWSLYEPDLDGTLIAYASIYGNTGGAAATLALELEQRGRNAMVVDLARADISEVVALAFRYPRAVLACSTYDGDIFPPMHTLLHHLAAKGWRNRRVGLIQNGSWAPAAARVMTKHLEAMKDITIVEPVVTLRTRLSAANVAEIAALAAALG